MAIRRGHGERRVQRLCSSTAPEFLGSVQPAGLELPLLDPQVARASYTSPSRTRHSCSRLGGSDEPLAHPPLVVTEKHAARRCSHSSSARRIRSRSAIVC